jgi:hypothetical protein
LTACLGLSLSACAPTISILEVDVKLPAELPLSLKGKQMAVFTPVYDSIGKSDSLLMSRFSEGLASALATETALPDPLPLFTHDCGTVALGTLSQPEYALALAQESSSDMVFLVDSVHVGTFESKGVSSVSDGFRKELITVPFYSVVRVFDTIACDFVKYIPLKDSVFWEVWVDSKVEHITVPHTALADLEKVSGHIATSLVRSFSDQWETQDRVVFVYNMGPWQEAFAYAESFEWEKARAIWLGLLEGKNARKVSCAAFNLALTCEIAGQIDLAKEWLDYAAKTYSMPEITYYRQLLDERNLAAKRLLKPIY